MPLSHRNWEILLSLARARGWQPMGTELNRDSVLAECGGDEAAAAEILAGWGGSYLSNDYQSVRAADAANLAAALDGAEAELVDPGDAPLLRECLDLFRSGGFFIA